MIRGYSNLTVGRYECRVSTSIGDNSVFVNVSYFGECVLCKFANNNPLVIGSTVDLFQ